MSDSLQNTANPPTAAHFALATTVSEIEQAAAQAGWDQPPTLFALVKTADLLAEDSSLPAELRVELAAQATGPNHLTAIMQEELPTLDIEELLGQLAWPEKVSGVALSVERLVAPPSVAEELPADNEEAVAVLLTHPDREEVRLVVGVLRTGESWCLLRARNLDEDEKVGSGSLLAPGLVEALAATLQ